MQDSSDFFDGISQTIKEIAEKCAIPVNNCDKTRITGFTKPVVTQAVSETDIAKRSLKTVCKAVLQYLATTFNDTNMALLQELDGLDELSPDWLSFPKLKTLVDQACISKRQCWR